MAEKKGTRSVLANLVPPPKPPAAELAAIRARAVAAGFKPTEAAVLATYNRNQARAAASGRPSPQPSARAIANAGVNARFKRDPATPAEKPSTVNRKAPTSMRKVPARGALDQLAAVVGSTVGRNVESTAEAARRISDVGRYTLPGSERQLLGAIGRAFEGALPGRVQAPRNDTREALLDQQAFRRRFEQTGSTRPPYHLTAAEFRLLSPRQRQRMQRLGGIRITR